MTPYLGAIKAALIVALLVGTFAFGYHSNHGKQKFEAEIAAATAEQNREYRVLESKRSTNVIEAQNAATIRNKKLQVAADSSAATANSLRDDIANIRRDMPGLADDAIRQRADTLGSLLAECTANYQSMARTADAIDSDRQTLMQAWPAE